MLVVPGTAAAQSVQASPFGDYRSAPRAQYGTPPPPTTTPTATVGVTATTPVGTVTAGGGLQGTTGGGGKHGGSGAAPTNGNGNGNPGGSSQLPAPAGGHGPIQVAPSANGTRQVKGTLPFTGSDLTLIVLIALAAVSLGLFARAGERWTRRYRRSGTAN